MSQFKLCFVLPCVGVQGVREVRDKTAFHVMQDYKIPKEEVNMLQKVKEWWKETDLLLPSLIFLLNRAEEQTLILSK